MERKSIVLFSLIVLISFWLNDYCVAGEVSVKPEAVRQQNAEYSSEELPIIMIAYGLFCARYEEVKCLESAPDSALMRLGKSIDALPGGISTGLAFVHRAYIVQNGLKGNIAGFLRIKNKPLENSEIPFVSALFVTTPIESFGNSILVILSSVSPEQTIIFSVDNKLNAVLLYDSLKKNIVKNEKEVAGSPALYSVYNILVKRPGLFELIEIRDRGAMPFQTIEDRKFIVDVTKGVFELSFKARKNAVLPK